MSILSTIKGLPCGSDIFMKRLRPPESIFSAERDLAGYFWARSTCRKFAKKSENGHFAPTRFFIPWLVGDSLLYEDVALMLTYNTWYTFPGIALRCAE